MLRSEPKTNPLRCFAAQDWSQQDDNVFEVPRGRQRLTGVGPAAKKLVLRKTLQPLSLSRR